MTKSSIQPVVIDQESASRALDELAALRAEVTYLRAQRDALQRQCTAQAIELRCQRRGATKLTGQVSAFMHAFDQPMRDVPGVPIIHKAGGLVGDRGFIDIRTIRLRAEIVLEEAFEFAHSCFLDDATHFDIQRKTVRELIRACVPHVSLPGVADACADLDYVVEGARLTFGIDGGPVADEVHRTNMLKLGGPLDPHTGKKLKPPGWKPPDLEAVLRLQGWKPL